MRAVLLILMITLMPLRGWLGDAMALQMAVGHTSNPIISTTQTVATHADPTRATALFDSNSEATLLPCHGAAPGPGDATATATPHAHPELSYPAAYAGDCADCADHPACQACEVCHTVALTRAVNALPALALPTQALQSGQAQFASVPRAPHLKPPIS